MGRLAEVRMHMQGMVSPKHTLRQSNRHRTGIPAGEQMMRSGTYLATSLTHQGSNNQGAVSASLVRQCCKPWKALGIYLQAGCQA